MRFFGFLLLFIFASETLANITGPRFGSTLGGMHKGGDDAEAFVSAERLLDGDRL